MLYAVDAAGSHIPTGYGQTYRTSTWGAGASYRQAATDAVAQRASDGMLAFGGGSGPALFKPGARTPYRVYNYGEVSPLVQSDGLAFGRKNLYAVTSDEDATAFHVRVITPRKQATATITTSKRHVSYGKRVRVMVSVNRRDKHAKVSIYAHDVRGHRHLVSTGAVDRRGHFSVRARVKERTSFAAVVHDNSRYDGVTEIARGVTVAAAVRTRFIKPAGHSGKYALYHPSQKASLEGHVLPDHSDGCLTFHLQLFARGHWGFGASTGCVSLRFHSRAIGFVQGDRRLIGIPMRMRAEWAGDERNTARTSRWRYCMFVRGSGREGPTSAPRVGRSAYAAEVTAPRV
jgi:hypothetical protein